MPPRRAGFTLLELLVAIAIMALIAVVAWRGVASLTGTRERLVPQADKIHDDLAGLGQIERDLSQAPGSAALFALATPAVRVLAVDGHPSLQILRLAEASDGKPGHAAQNVLYEVRGGRLVRRASAAQRILAPGGGGFADEGVALVEDVDALQVRVWPANGTDWIVPASDADLVNALGLEVDLLRRDGTRLRGVFAIG